jgi:hypothetical protein
MIKNFDQIKKQLHELAEIVNAFKSETVQLRVVELIFSGDLEETQVDDFKGPDHVGHKNIRTGKGKRTGVAESKSSGGAKLVGRGAKATMARLFDQGFFKKPQTIASLVEHCKINLASHFKQSDFSGALARYVRDGKLKRSKNKENQYEYTQS